MYDDDQDTFCLDWWAPNYTKIKEMARAQHVLHPAAPKFAEPKRFTGTPRTRPRNLSGKKTTLKETPEKCSTRDRVQDAETQRLTARKRGGFEHANQRRRFRRYGVAKNWKTPTCLVVVTTRNATGR